MKASSSSSWLRVSSKKQEFLLTALVLALVYILAFIVRLFAVIRFESVIHEFDPYFNFRTTRYLVNEGFYEFINWFDNLSWYPLGRIVGGTIYPGLMMTAAATYHVLHFFNFTVDIRNVCVFTAPWFAGNTAMITFLFAKEIDDSTATGLVAAGLISVVPGYISRSVAGSYDNEAIAIFTLILTFYMWVKAVKTGSIYWGTLAALAYFYMVSAWGGYVFIINLIPMHVLALLATGRYSSRLYVAYCTFYVSGSLMAMQIPFVGFQHVQSSEHMVAMGTFLLLQAFVFLRFLRTLLGEKLFNDFFRFAVTVGLAVAVAVLTIGQLSGYISPWTGRFYSLLDPTYAKKHIPIIASVSEHQPTTWASYFFDLHILTFLFPAGLYFSFRRLTDANVFAILYGVTAVYFSGVMVRLMLVLAPIACVLGAVAISHALRAYMQLIKPRPPRLLTRKDLTEKEFQGQGEVGYVLVAAVAILCVLFVLHSVWVTAEAYSSPSIVLAANQPDGSRVIFDDFREAYWWLRMNTAPDARVMSWWDYGYQITAMANRTVLVDNNTWNNTHISQVGQAMSSNETTAYEIMKRLDVDYVLVIFGGLTGYSSDDINKFLWMVRIGGSTNPRIKEEDYFAQGQYRVDAGASPTMLNCLMFALDIHVYTERGQPTGFDRVRGVEIGNKDFELTHLVEAFTSEHWIVRIYKVTGPRGANRQ